MDRSDERGNERVMGFIKSEHEGPNALDPARLGKEPNSPVLRRGASLVLGM